MILAIDTTGPINKISVYHQEHFYSNSWQNEKFGNEKLLFQIDKLFQQHRLLPSQIEKILIYPGPGSYTGLRVGFSVAQALAQANQIDIYAAKSKNLKQEINNIQKNIGRTKNPEPIYKNS